MKFYFTLYIDILRNQVERRKRNKLKELEHNKRSKKKIFKNITSTRSSVDENMKKFYLDHNGVMIKRESYPIRVDALPNFKRTLNHKVIKEHFINNADASKSLKKGKSGLTYFSSKESLPEDFKHHATKLDISGPLEDRIDLKYGVRMITASGERRVGQLNKTMETGDSINFEISRRNTVGTTVSFKVYDKF